MTKRLTQGKQVDRVEPPSADLIEKVLLNGDLSQLTPEQRLHYYRSVCDTLKLNPLTKPFDYITLDGKLVLYATKDAAAQLRKKQRISIEITQRQQQDSVYIVTAKATLISTVGSTPRCDEAIGVVPTMVVESGKSYPLTPKALANAIMKAETKAKRRVTLSICGLGMLDESEIEPMEIYEKPSNEIIERNVTEATANATGEPVVPDTAVTKDNYGDVVCHVGKAEGNILGKKVGEIHPKIIEWLVINWIPKLAAVPSAKDARLRDAILLAQQHPRANGEAESKLGDLVLTKDQPEGKLDIGARQAAMNDLRGRIEDLVLTEDQFVQYMNGQSVSDQKWTKLEDMSDSMLLYLCTPKAWAMASEGIKAMLRPKVDETLKPKKRRKKKEKGPFDV